MYITPKTDYYQVFPLSNIHVCFGPVKETQRNDHFTHTKHVLWTDIKIVHKYAILSESNVFES